jgi:hypothetical protein
MQSPIWGRNGGFCFFWGIKPAHKGADNKKRRRIGLQILKGTLSYLKDDRNDCHYFDKHGFLYFAKIAPFQPIK